MNMYYTHYWKRLGALGLVTALGAEPACAVESVGAPFERGRESPPATNAGEESVRTRQGTVSVFWSAWNGAVMASAAFLDTGNGCSVRESGSCREFTCGSRTPSLSAGPLHVRGSAPSFMLDVEHRAGVYFGSIDARERSQGTGAPSKSGGSRLLVAAAGSPTVPAFETEIAYPAQLVLTHPPADDPDSVPSVPKKNVRLPRSETVIVRWTGGAPDVQFRIEGAGTSESRARSVVCEAASTEGAMEIDARILDSLVLRAFTVAERRITTGAWPVTVRLGTEVLVRSGPAGTAYYIADLGGG